MDSTKILHFSLLGDGIVFVWGDGSSGQLGLGSGISNVKQPHPISLDYRITKAHTGLLQTIFYRSICHSLLVKIISIY